MEQKRKAKFFRFVGLSQAEKRKGEQRERGERYVERERERERGRRKKQDHKC